MVVPYMELFLLVIIVVVFLLKPNNKSSKKGGLSDIEKFDMFNKSNKK